ncbi:MAG TPA: DNA gyrase subunit A [Spirochaetota bacterium]|nr:DNA gyrase subunit A [Spirochaetota bacterium]
MKTKQIIKKQSSIAFHDQLNNDQKRYSRYVCDSRAIPNEIDGLKPVQRRILWTMWNSVARKYYTKTVKIAGLVMGYHPHGDAAITDAISAMAQDFTFANNYPLVAGEGTFGDVLDPKAVASPRYTEVKISDFALDAGLFESIPDIDYTANYDETSREPVYFVPKVPLVLLNNITGIATGFRCHIPGHKLTDIVNSMIKVLKKRSPGAIKPWYKNFSGKSSYWRNDNGFMVYTTGFGFKKKDKTFYLTAAPQSWHREKVINLLDDIISRKNTPVKNYIDHSTSNYKIELVLKKGSRMTSAGLQEIFAKVNNEIIVQNVITDEGKLKNDSTAQIIKNFCRRRKIHLVRRFKRLAALESEKISKNNELIRFIKEKWNQKVLNIKNRKQFEGRLKRAKFKYFEWLSSIPVYRMTIEEVAKCRKAITEAKKMLKYYQGLYKQNSKLNKFIIDEITALKDKWDN